MTTAEQLAALDKRAAELRRAYTAARYIHDAAHRNAALSQIGHDLERANIERLHLELEGI